MESALVFAYGPTPMLRSTTMYPLSLVYQSIEKNPNFRTNGKSHRSLPTAVDELLYELLWTRFRHATVSKPDLQIPEIAGAVVETRETHLSLTRVSALNEMDWQSQLPS